MNNAYFYHYTLLLLIMGIPHTSVSMKRTLEEKPTIYKFMCDDKSAPKLSSPDRFFHELPVDILCKIIARSPRNALRKTCKFLAELASINKLSDLVTHANFQGSKKDIIKACEQCIEADNHTKLKNIITQDGINTTAINEIGYSLTEYALLLDRDHCLSVLCPADKQDIISVNISVRASDIIEAYTDKKLTDMVANSIMMTRLLDALYTHKVKKNDVTINNLLKLPDPFIDNEYIYLSLHIATYNNDIDLIKSLSERSDKSNDIEHMAINIACIRGLPECVALLLNAGYKPNMPSIEVFENKEAKNKLQHKKALCNAAQHGSYECARLILDSGTLVNQEEQCQLALLYAADSGCTELVDLLLALNTDPNINNNETLEVFANDSSVDIQEECYYQPLDVATEHNNILIAQKLIDAGAAVTDFAIERAQANGYNNMRILLEEKRTNETPPTQPYISDDEKPI